MSRATRLAIILAAVLVCAREDFAKTRATRVLDWRSGLPVSFVVAAEQDPEGFIWVTSWAGIFRYDGSQMVRAWDGDSIVPGSAAAGMPLRLRKSPDQEVLNRDGSPVQGPDGGTLRTEIAFVAGDGALWALQQRAFFRRARQGSWSGPFDLPAGAEINAGPSRGRDGSILVPCRDAVYRFDGAGRRERVATVHGPIQSLDRSDGSTVIGCIVSGGGGRVYEVRAGNAIEIDRCPTRFMGLAERAGALWVCYDSHLARIARGEPRETITGADGLLTGGALLVDREASLWVATFRGLLQFPEPDSVSWQAEAACVGRRVIAHRGMIWMSSWSGLYRASLETTGWEIVSEPGHINAPCVDRSGTVWAAGEAFTVSADRIVRHVHAASLPEAGDCTSSASGRVWFPTASGIFLLEPGDHVPRLVLPAGSESEPFSLVYEDSRGTLWGGRKREVCRAPVAEVLHTSTASAPLAWSCASVGGAVTRLLETESGALWASTMGAGVWRLREGRWEPIPAAADLASSWASAIAPSPSGGVWITGEGIFVRVRERVDLPAGWELLEKVGLWQGLPTAGVIDVVEIDDGTLWAATNLSLVRIPVQARRTRPEPPPVALVEVSVDGRPLDTSPGRVIELPYRRNRLELRFAALSYRDPGLIRYRVRLSTAEAWSAPTKQPSFRFVDLPSGKYRVDVEASLDGERWSRPSREMSFIVLRPWYRTWWFTALSTLVLAGALGLAYRLRVHSLLRLERQRMRIAMDLHDEVGSGLGSIGVLAGLLDRPDLPQARRADLTARITGVAGELSQSLGDIVWSLRASSGSLHSLWEKILDRARPLFAGGSSLLSVEAPETIPDVPLSLTVRRNVSLIAIEALHNAARHAEASTVALSLHIAGEDFRIEVSDDGRGFLPDHPADATRRGLGVEGMKLRAAEMGGSVTWRTTAGGGTTVVIRFRSGRG